MFPQTINAAPTADEKIARLTKQATLNLAMHMKRLGNISDNFTRAVESFEGLERQYLISVLYTTNETIALLKFMGLQDIMDAVFLGNLDARDYYDEAINVVHSALLEDEGFKKFEAMFEEQMSLLKPELKQPMPDELGDDEHLTEKDREKLAGEPGLEEMAGEQPEDEFGINEDHIDPTEDTDVVEHDIEFGGDRAA